VVGNRSSIFADRRVLVYPFAARRSASRIAGGAGVVEVMAKKLKVFQTSLGFFDQAIAAPSMKAALDAWGADSNLFHQGVATQSDDPDVIAAAMSKPGVILRRPVGSDGPFRERADLPTRLSGEGPIHGPKKLRATSRTQPRRGADDKTVRNPSAALGKARKQREKARREEEAARARQRTRRQQATAKAQAALETARREHDRRAATIEAARAALDKRAQAENARWRKQEEKLTTALRRARDE
jgi:hypothetical protein